MNYELKLFPNEFQRNYTVLYDVGGQVRWIENDHGGGCKSMVEFQLVPRVDVKAPVELPELFVDSGPVTEFMGII